MTEIYKLYIITMILICCFLTETWTSKSANIRIVVLCSFSCPRPKTNRRVNRFSGGVIIYYNDTCVNNIALVDLYYNCVIWFKLKKDVLMTFTSVHDTYIPHEESSVCRNCSSVLCEYHFFEQLNDIIRKYSYCGGICCTADVDTGRSSTHRFMCTIFSSTVTLIYRIIIPTGPIFQHVCLEIIRSMGLVTGCCLFVKILIYLLQMAELNLVTLLVIIVLETEMLRINPSDENKLRYLTK